MFYICSVIKIKIKDMAKKKIAFPKQVRYKKTFKDLGLKQDFVASKTGIHKTNLSSYINGHLFMTDNIQGKLDKFLTNYKNMLCKI